MFKKVVNAEIGLRMLSIRNKLTYSQSKMSAILDISNNTYKNYELGRREIPLGVANDFCDKFKTDLGWLVSGVNSSNNDNTLEIVEYVANAIYLAAENKFDRMGRGQFGKVFRKVFHSTILNNADPVKEAVEIMEFIQ